MTDLRYLNVILTVLAVVLTLNLLVTVSTGPSLLPEAQAKEREPQIHIPDGGAQRAQIVEELQALNRKADNLRDLLVSGQVTVKLSNPR